MLYCTAEPDITWEMEEGRGFPAFPSSCWMVCEVSAGSRRGSESGAIRESAAICGAKLERCLNQWLFPSPMPLMCALQRARQRCKLGGQAEERLQERPLAAHQPGQQRSGAPQPAEAARHGRVDPQRQEGHPPGGAPAAGGSTPGVKQPRRNLPPPFGNVGSWALPSTIAEESASVVSSCTTSQRSSLKHPPRGGSFEGGGGIGGGSGGGGGAAGWQGGRQGRGGGGELGAQRPPRSWPAAAAHPGSSGGGSGGGGIHPGQWGFADGGGGAVWRAAEGGRASGDAHRSARPPAADRDSLRGGATPGEPLLPPLRILVAEDNKVRAWLQLRAQGFTHRRSLSPAAVCFIDDRISGSAEVQDQCGSLVFNLSKVQHTLRHPCKGLGRLRWFVRHLSIFAATRMLASWRSAP